MHLFWQQTPNRPSPAISSMSAPIVINRVDRLLTRLRRSPLEWNPREAWCDQCWCWTRLLKLGPQLWPALIPWAANKHIFSFLDGWESEKVNRFFINYIANLLLEKKTFEILLYSIINSYKKASCMFNIIWFDLIWNASIQ